MDRDGNAPIAWTEETAHDGRRSLRLRQTGEGRLATHPVGAVCRVRGHTRYRFRAWVKTEQVTAQARLELAGYAYTYDNITHCARSRGLVGSADWTLLEADLDSGNQAYLMPYLVLEGPGTAWFDELGLYRID